MEHYRTYLKQPARQLRSNPTDAEQKLWQRIRRKQIHGLQFYRQKPLLNYIVDFYCPKAHLVIEVDGSQHRLEANQRKDVERDKALSELGLQVLRFDDRQVLTEMEGVLAATEAVLEEGLKSPPNHPFSKGGICGE